MKISTEIASFKKYGSNRQILQLLKNAGFECYDFSMFLQTEECFIYCDDYLEQAKQLREFADSIGIECNQAHAPFPIYLPQPGGFREFLLDSISNGLGKNIRECANPDEEFHQQMKVLIYRAVEIAGILGAKNCVVHPFNDYDAQQNCQMYQQFVSASHKYGAKIAVENMWNWDDDKEMVVPAACSHHDDFKKHLDLLPADTFVACLDIGHAEMQGLRTDIYQMITTLDRRLACLHVHDNDTLHDNHHLPYTSKIDFSKMVKALQQISYTGDITFEADSYMRCFDVEFFPTAAKYMYDIGDYLRKQIQNK